MQSEHVLALELGPYLPFAVTEAVRNICARWGRLR